MKKRTIISVLVTVAVVVVGAGAHLLTPKAAQAQDPFGGRSESAFYCNCNGCWKIDVGGPRGGTFMYCSYHLYRQYNIFPPAWQLGRAGPWVPCLVVCYPTCCVEGGGFNVRFVGTSLY